MGIKGSKHDTLPLIAMFMARAHTHVPRGVHTRFHMSVCKRLPHHLSREPYITTNFFVLNLNKFNINPEKSIKIRIILKNP